jgi:16S rRNA (guanine527-N7)-methyltransferase
VKQITIKGKTLNNNNLINVFHQYNIKIDEKTAENMVIFNNLMLDYNKIHNLTTITEEQDVILKHLLDSVLPIDLLEENKKIIDIGCGAGFPSIPLSIMNNKLHITALDSVKKKINFVESIKNALNLTNLQPIHARIEDFTNKNNNRESFDIVISRAVAPLNIILEYSAPLLKNGGYIIAYKGSNYLEEVESAKNAMKLLDCNIEDIKEYHIQELETSRFVLKIKKNSKISNKYPRTGNKPRLQPL